ncbi:MAG TPA: tocopherol cyclase family protein [Propionibacteriaceae bacterium]|nr:tocopherol cyclase family protein [Propionibacteriaceae bacterium]
MASPLIRLATGVQDAYRASGADGAWGDPERAHGVAMEGYFWRITDRASGRVIIALCGINTPGRNTTPSGNTTARTRPWATVGLATTPDGVLVTSAPDGCTADPDALGARVPDVFEGAADHLEVTLDGASLSATFTDLQRWPRARLGGSSAFQMIPGLNQYWHPWLLGGRASGTLRLGERVITFSDAQVYGEKNWGAAGFPDAWWWGQAQGFTEPDACVAFAGGDVTVGPRVLGRQVSTHVTAVVVRAPDGSLIRLGNPGTSPVRASITPGRWLLTGDNPQWRVRIDGHAPESRGFVLPVPLVGEGRNTPGAIEHLDGSMEVRVWRRGRLFWHGTSEVAGLERGGREHAETVLAARRGDPRPQPGR